MRFLWSFSSFCFHKEERQPWQEPSSVPGCCEPLEASESHSWQQVGSCLMHALLLFFIVSQVCESQEGTNVKWSRKLVYICSLCLCLCLCSRNTQQGQQWRLTTALPQRHSLIDPCVGRKWVHLQALWSLWHLCTGGGSEQHSLCVNRKEGPSYRHVSVGGPVLHGMDVGLCWWLMCCSWSLHQKQWVTVFTVRAGQHSLLSGCVCFPQHLVAAVLI